MMEKTLLTAEEQQALWDLTKFLFVTLADIDELLDPRSRIPRQDSQTAKAKAVAALKVAKRAGVMP